MKKIFKMLLLLALLAFGTLFGVIGWQFASAKGPHATAIPTMTAPPSPTATNKPGTCKVNTGIDGGTVNLRECKGAACGRVLDILTEGASLDIITVGESTGYASLYVNVTTEGGVTGWLNKKYCEVKP